MAQCKIGFGENMSGLHKNGHTNMDGAKMSADHFKIRLLNTDIEKNRKGELEYIQEMNR